MKLKAPEGCTGFSVGGREYTVPKSRVVVVEDERQARTLIESHGFVDTEAPVEDEAATEAPK